MNFKHKILAVLLIPGFVTMLKTNAFPQTKIAIHATQAEVDIWKKRAINGPYKNGWDTIKNRADAWVASPESRWAGNTTTVCYNASTHGVPARTRDRGMRDAGFVYLVTGTASYRDAVLTQLLNQVKVTGTDFSNKTTWCVPGSPTLFETSNWLRRLVYAYSYIRDGISAGNKSTLDTWFSNAGYYFAAHVHDPIAVRFPNRLLDDYASCASAGSCPGKDDGLLYYGGPMTKTFHEAWNNQPAVHAAMIAAIGVVTDDATLKARAKRFVQEWLKFAVWPEGAVVDQNRWRKGQTPQVAYTYAGTAIGSIVTIADHLARAGDTSLYKFATSDGMFGTQGGSKKPLVGLTALCWPERMAQFVSMRAPRQTSDPRFLIDPTAELTGKNVIAYINMAPANLYYKDQSVKKAYQTPIPRSYASGGYDPLGGDWGSYPDILFMFGGLENIVWPYPDQSSQNVPSSSAYEFCPEPIIKVFVTH